MAAPIHAPQLHQMFACYVDHREAEVNKRISPPTKPGYHLYCALIAIGLATAFFLLSAYGCPLTSLIGKVFFVCSFMLGMTFVTRSIFSVYSYVKIK